MVVTLNMKIISSHYILINYFEGKINEAFLLRFILTISSRNSNEQLKFRCDIKICDHLSVLFLFVHF